MNAHKHMEAIFGGVLIIACVVALMPTRHTRQPWAVASPPSMSASEVETAAASMPTPLPVVVITAKRMTAAEKRRAPLADAGLAGTARQP